MERTSLRELMLLGAKGAGSGADYISGTFTVVDDATSYTIDFGKTFDRYLFLVEMDDASKTVLVATGIDGNKLYALSGIYPIPSINNTTPNAVYAFQRINPSTEAVSTTSGSGFINTSTPPSSTQITLNCADVTAATSNAYRGYTYHYYVVEIK